MALASPRGKAHSALVVCFPEPLSRRFPIGSPSPKPVFQEEVCVRSLLTSRWCGAASLVTGMAILGGILDPGSIGEEALLWGGVVGLMFLYAAVERHGRQTATVAVEATHLPRR
jgi:hypothetical protein